MRRSLPLLSRPDRPAVDSTRSARLPLAHAIGVADTSHGAAAARFSVELAAGLRTRQIEVQVAWLSYEGVPSDLQGLRARASELELEVALFGVDEQAPVLTWPEPSACARLTILAGLPALLSFAPQLAILLEGERPLASWPLSLRGQRDTCQLTLQAERAGCAAALASALAQSDFLPRR